MITCPYDNEIIIPITSVRCGDVNTPLDIDWVREYCENGIIVTSKDYKKLNREEMGYQIATLKYKRFVSLLELLEEVRSKYSKFVINKFDFVNRGYFYIPEDWYKFILAFTNNYRNHPLLYRYMITFFYCFELSTDGYWHCHLAVITTDKWGDIPYNDKYQAYLDDMYGLAQWFRGTIIRTLGPIDSVNYTNRTPKGYRSICYSKSDNVYSINCDLVWASYFCKENRLTKEFLQQNKHYKLFGKGKVR